MTLITIPRSSGTSEAARRIVGAGERFERECEEDRRRAEEAAQRRDDAAAAKALDAARKACGPDHSLPPLPPRWRNILIEVAERHRLGAADLFRQDRRREIVAARYEAFYLIASLDGSTLLGMGRRLRRDHTSVRHAVLKHIKVHPGLPVPMCIYGSIPKVAA